MENTPHKIMRQAIESALNSDEETPVPAVEAAPEEQQPEQARRGRRRIPDQWTRVVSLLQDDLEQLRTHLHHQDLLLSENMVRAPPARFHNRNYDPTFWPDEWVKGHLDFSLEANALTEAKLKQYGLKASQLRKRLRA